MAYIEDMYGDDLYEEIMRHPAAERIVTRAREQLDREAVTRREFREWLTPSVKAEFINGEIVLHSPVKRAHLIASKCLFQLLHTYVVDQQLGQVDFEKALIELGRNDFEPDICFWRAARTTEWNADTMIHPAPDLIVEVLSGSTEANDRGLKYESYLAFGVEEYWIVDPVRQILEQYIRQSDGDEDDATYQLVGKQRGTQSVSSVVLEGLEFPAETAFSEAKVLEWVRRLLDGGATR